MGQCSGGAVTNDETRVHPTTALVTIVYHLSFVWQSTDSSTCVECSGGYCRLISDSAFVVRETCFRQSVGVIYIQTHMTSYRVLPTGGSDDMPVTILLSHCFLGCSCGGLWYDSEAVPMKRVYISARNSV